MQFHELDLIEPLLRAVRAEGYTEPTPIQAQAIPHLLEGRDLLGCAQTGTGKTAAFALPILQRLATTPAPQGNPIRVLVLSPTRELASQIGESFQNYGRYIRMRQLTIFGGVNQNPQVDRLRRGTDILVATPGRLLDLMGQGFIRLDKVEVLVLDEADRMLDMGFINDVRKIIDRMPTKRQTLLFSATMPTEIASLANSILTNPVEVAVTPVASTVETIDQTVFFVEKVDKPNLLEHLLRDPSIKRVLVFTRTKHGADKVVTRLRHASIYAEAIHGNKSQNARTLALSNFKDGRTRVLVATDIAERGIDVEEITHVINYDLPNEPESYVHRIGRTGRAGASGSAYSFCEETERPYLVDIERLIQLHIPRAEGYPYASHLGMPAITDLSPRTRQRNQQQNRPAGRPQQQNHRRPFGSGGQRRNDGFRGDRRGNGDRRQRDASNSGNYR
ncbi:MAG: DEAD/DEAH box helicase [Anaerolineae bacterium]|nr:DEAD/DEAH box helicase [Anaerolineae bacterium]